MRPSFKSVLTLTIVVLILFGGMQLLLFHLQRDVLLHHVYDQAMGELRRARTILEARLDLLHRNTLVLAGNPELRSLVRRPVNRTGREESGSRTFPEHLLPDMDLLLVLDTHGDLLYSSCKNLDRDAPHGFCRDMALEQIFMPSMEQVRSSGTAIKGIVHLRGHIFFFTALPYQTMGQGDAPDAVMVTGKAFSRSMAMDLGFPDFIRLTPFENRNVSYSVAGQDDLDLASITDDSVSVASVLTDTLGNPALMLVATMGRYDNIPYASMAQTQSLVLGLSIILLLIMALTYHHHALTSRTSQLLHRLTLALSPESRQRIEQKTSQAGQAQDPFRLLEEAIAAGIQEMAGADARARRAEAKDLQLEQYYRSILDNMDMGMVLVDPATHTIVDVNRHMSRMTGYERDEMIGRICHDMICPAELGRCPVTDLGQSVDISHRTILTRGGNSLPVLKSVCHAHSPTGPLLLETILPPRALRNIESGGSGTARIFRKAFFNSASPMLIMAPDSTILMVNPEFETLSGFQAPQLIDRKLLYDFLHRSDADRIRSYMSLHSDSPPPPLRYEVRFADRNGDMRFIVLTMAHISQADSFVVSLMDTTDQMLAQERLRSAHEGLERTVEKRTQELREANRSLENLNRQKSSFLSSASHELRTPLTAIMGFAKLMQRNFARHFEPLVNDNNTLQDKAKEFSANLDIIIREGDRLTRLVNDLLDLNRIESGRMVWRSELIDPAALVTRCATTMAGHFEATPEVELAIHVPAHLPHIVADPDRLEQVILNLLGNAHKFTQKGHVLLSVAEVPPNTLEIRVSDTGVGIPEHEQPHIFEKFFQARHQEEELRDKPMGTGLGLAICKQIVSRHGGQIRVTSHPGQGSTFIVSLPI